MNVGLQDNRIYDGEGLLCFPNLSDTEAGNMKIYLFIYFLINNVQAS